MMIHICPVLCKIRPVEFLQNGFISKYMPSQFMYQAIFYFDFEHVLFVYIVKQNKTDFI